MKKTLATLFCLGLLSVSSARCQQETAEMREVRSAMGFAGPVTSDRAVEADVNKATGEINAATDSSNSIIKYTRQVSGLNRGKFSTLTVTASAPLDDSSDRTELVSLDGLTNAFTMGVKYTWFNLTGVTNPLDDADAEKKSDEICDQLTAAYQEKTAKKDVPTCDTATVQEYLPAKYKEFKNLFFSPDGWTFSGGFEPKVGYKKFEFLDSLNLAKLSDAKTPWSVQAFLGFKPRRLQTLITLGGSYQKGFKDADKGTLCPVSSGTGPVTCKTGAIGRPVSDDAELVYLEVRHRLGPAGASLKFTYDFKQDLTGVDLPIAFVKDGDGNLRGGIRAGWTRTGHWQAGIFVGSGFSLNP
ncbi:MAG: hypothetical protein ABIS20_18305 [Thermoanaerobaculia bacterium]